MNGENVNQSGSNAEMKSGVSRTRISYGMDHLGYAARELFVQFLHRIMLELPNATLAVFSKLKYINSPNFSHFRDRWTAKYIDGFVVQSKAFDGLKGDFPIGFFIWDLATNQQVQSIGTIALDKSGTVVGQNIFYRQPPRPPLSKWIIRPRSNKTRALPLENVLSPTTRTKDIRGFWWADGAIGSMMCNGNDFQHASKATALLSSGYNSAGAFFVTEQNLWQSAIVFSVRRLIKPTWINDRDQFLQPSEPLSDEFKTDCLVWMLFNGSNLSAGADDLHWDDRPWSLINHFIPYREAEVGAQRFESDFMVRYMAGMTFSSEAQTVLDEGRRIWRRYHTTGFPNKIREELKLNRADAGWYQVRRALEAYSDVEQFDFDPFRAAYVTLTEKLRPMVYDLGFLP